MRKTAAIMLGEGFEPVEAIAPADALRRAGVAVTLVSTMGEAVVEAAHGIRVTADALEADVDLGAFDLLVVPGGSLGVENLAKSDALAAALRERMADGRLVGAICAGPTILADLGLLEGRRAVCYPGCEGGFPAGAYQEGLGVCVDGNLVTATGPGRALDFAIACLRAVAGDAVADEVAADMLMAR